MSECTGRSKSSPDARTSPDAPSPASPVLIALCAHQHEHPNQTLPGRADERRREGASSRPGWAAVQLYEQRNCTGDCASSAKASETRRCPVAAGATSDEGRGRSPIREGRQCNRASSRNVRAAPLFSARASEPDAAGRRPGRLPGQVDARHRRHPRAGLCWRWVGGWVRACVWSIGAFGQVGGGRADGWGWRVRGRCECRRTRGTGVTHKQARGGGGRVGGWVGREGRREERWVGGHAAPESTKRRSDAAGRSGSGSGSGKTYNPSSETRRTYVPTSRNH